MYFTAQTSKNLKIKLNAELRNTTVNRALRNRANAEIQSCRKGIRLEEEQRCKQTD